MKKFLLIFSSVMGVLASVQAADEISVQVTNTSWWCKTRLECCVDYGNHKETFNLILEGTTEINSTTTTHHTLPKGSIQSIQLDLTNYHEVPELDDMAATLLANLVFTPLNPGLLNIIFEIKENTIIPAAVYG